MDLSLLTLGTETVDGPVDGEALERSWSILSTEDRVQDASHNVFVRTMLSSRGEGVVEDESGCGSKRKLFSWPAPGRLTNTELREMYGPWMTGLMSYSTS